MNKLKQRDLKYFYENRTLIYKVGFDCLNIWRVKNKYVVQYCGNGDKLLEYFTTDLNDAFNFIEEQVKHAYKKNDKTKIPKCEKTLADIELFRKTGKINYIDDEVIF